LVKSGEVLAGEGQEGEERGLEFTRARFKRLLAAER
jgi:hypothetical protein